MSSETLHYCDICKKECAPLSKKIQVIFESDQTDGAFCLPYLELADIDLCSDCLNKLLGGKCIFATGAQGYNQYYFKKGIYHDEVSTN